MDIIITIVIFVFSIVAHEYAHGYSAYLFGDSTAKDNGRLTFNPIPHIDLWWSIILPIMIFISSGGKMIFGGAKPVPINPMRFSNRRLGISLVSASGPMANLTLAFGAALLLNVLIFIGFNIGFLNMVLFNCVVYNLALAFFNLIPIPPLDGSKLLVYLLPPEYEYHINRMEFFGFIILIIALNFGLFNVVYSKIILPLIFLIIP